MTNNHLSRIEIEINHYNFVFVSLNKTMRYHMRPKDKFDIKACKKLKEYNDEELIEMGEWLSGWLGDANFPIFIEIVEIFVERQDTLLPFISNIFYSNDSICIYWVLLELYPKLSYQNQVTLAIDLEHCLHNISEKLTLDEDDENLKEILEKVLN